MRCLRILIVDDHEVVRRGVRSLLSARAEWSVCGEAEDGLEAIEKAKRLQPDIVLMDITMPRMDGVQATKVIRQEVPEAEVILISQNDPSVGRTQAADADARDFVAKIDLSRDLLSTIERVVGQRNPNMMSNRRGGERVALFDVLPASPSTSEEPALEQKIGGRMSQDIQNEPWCGLLDAAAPRDHIVQLYQDEKFLSRAVCRFAVSAINHGEGVILVPTSAHWNALRPRLEAEGVDVQTAQSCGQLTVVDADKLLPEFMRNAMPDAPLFLGLAGETIAQARGGARFTKVRWWGEMVNVLWERGDVAASMGLEDLFHKLAHDRDIAIFCSFLMDNFDGDVHARMLPRLGQNHSHLIPVEDYARLERAVAAALREAVGPADAGVLEQQLLTHYAAPLHMPRSQAMLLALRETLPLVADTVLQRSRNLYGGAAQSA
jgi:DNA-binding NarL/FixJ family response regulator